ncbi:unnamed protein product, partial [Dovyalis caffra]
AACSAGAASHSVLLSPTSMEGSLVRREGLSLHLLLFMRLLIRLAEELSKTGVLRGCPLGVGGDNKGWR